MFWGTQQVTVCAHEAWLCCALCLLVGGVNCAMRAMHSLWVSWDGADWDMRVYLLDVHIYLCSRGLCISCCQCSLLLKFGRWQ